MFKFDELWQREVTRRQFLTILGIAVLSFFGLASLMGAISSQTSPQKSRGYGRLTYGP